MTTIALSIAWFAIVGIFVLMRAEYRVSEK
jgi:hypothetical protein